MLDFFHFLPCLPFYFAVNYAFGIVARKTASSWIGIVSCCVFLTVRKALLFKVFPYLEYLV